MTDSAGALRQEAAFKQRLSAMVSHSNLGFIFFAFALHEGRHPLLA
jgi:hypothetical protein